MNRKRKRLDQKTKARRKSKAKPKPKPKPKRRKKKNTWKPILWQRCLCGQWFYGYSRYDWHIADCPTYAIFGHSTPPKLPVARQPYVLRRTWDEVFADYLRLRHAQEQLAQDMKTIEREMARTPCPYQQRPPR